MTLAFEDANSKLLDVVSDADVDDKECLIFGQDFEAELMSRF